jgi:hypothetical protein
MFTQTFHKIGKLRWLLVFLAILGIAAAYIAPTNAKAQHTNYSWTRFHSWADMDADNVKDTGGIDYCKHSGRKLRVTRMTGGGTIPTSDVFTVTMQSEADELVVYGWQWDNCASGETDQYPLLLSTTYALEMPDWSSDITYYTTPSYYGVERRAGFRFW